MENTLYREDTKYFGCARPEMLKYLPAGARRVLDVGCSNGTFGRSIKGVSGITEVWGVDINKAAIAEASQLVDKALCFDLSVNIDRLPDEYFDVIYFNDVLEHFPDPYLILKNIKPKLMKGGSIVASIPNIRFFRVLGDILFRKDFRYRDDGVMDRTHLRFFTEKSIVRMFEEQGYKVKTIEPINKTKSWRPWIYFIFSFGLIGRDIFYPQFAILVTS